MIRGELARPWWPGGVWKTTFVMGVRCVQPWLLLKWRARYVTSGTLTSKMAEGKSRSGHDDRHVL